MPIKAFESHLWYLTEELVHLALFSSNVEPKTKQLIKKVLVDRRVCSKRNGPGFGKMQLSDIFLTDSMAFSVFVGEDSWSFFMIMEMDEDFLCKPVSEWQLEKQYKSLLAIS